MPQLKTKARAKYWRSNLNFVLKKKKIEPTLEQQFKAIDDLSKSLTDEEKKEFIKVMDEMEKRND